MQIVGATPLSPTKNIMIPKDFFTTDYLFATQAPENQKLFLAVVGVFVLFIIISALIYYNQKIHKGLKVRLFNFFLTVGILGLIFSFFRFEAIPYIGARIIILLLLLAAIIWYLAITVYTIAKMPGEVRIIKNHERYVQYLPKQKIRRK